MSTQEQIAHYDKMWQEIADSANKHNKETDRRNNRLFRAIGKVRGKTFVKHVKEILEECEVSDEMGFTTELEIVRQTKGKFQHERYGKYIKGYWVEQYSVGLEGDSWTGYIYIEIKKCRFIKAKFNM